MIVSVRVEQIPNSDRRVVLALRLADHVKCVRLFSAASFVDSVRHAPSSRL
jgi:hypothetical protein